MSRSNISLLARSVSVLAIGVAAPTIVQAQDAPGVYQSDLDGNGVNLYVVPAGTTVFGQEDLGGFTSTAQVFCAASAGGDAEPADGGDDGPTCTDFGAITQVNAFTATAINSMLVVGAQVVRADATAFTGGLTTAVAAATIDTGVQQNLFFIGDAENHLAITGPGSLTVRADAQAQATTSSATADANISGAAIEQLILGATTAHNEIDMEGDINVVLNADATGTGWFAADADASAELDGFAVGQAIFGVDSGVNDFTNDNGGVVNIDVNAHAVASDDATAFATAEGGIGQFVTASTRAVNNFTNGVGGTIDIDISATAIGDTAVATANLGVEAGFFNNEGIGQHAEATSSISFATNNFTNSGAIDMDVVAIANADLGDADAEAHIDTGIWQFASATAAFGEAHNNLTNNLGASIGINAQATALANNLGATGGTASADATVGDGIFQSATADTSASVSIVNNGIIDISASALANGDFNADASASIGTGISQNASASTVADIDLTNSGTINVVADAHAIAGNPGATALVDGSADASATINTGIYQEADATGTGGDATVTLTNTGTINVVADAEADAGGTAQGSAYAFASIDTGIVQSASANGVSGFADVDLTNTGGTINISAIAEADGSEASATASITSGIEQDAHASGSQGVADIDLTNSGTITIAAAAHASAVGTTGNVGSIDADASATISDAGIDQHAHADGTSGVASADIVNSGTINITGDATAVAASGSADATVTVSSALYQSATADGSQGSASVGINNALGGTINIDANAVATGTDAFASASLSSAINQSANAAGLSGVASVDLTNAGTINLGAHAFASARDGAALGTNVGAATASATIDTGITQSANAAGSQGNASVSLVNSGAINFIAEATANGGTTADATANVTTAVVQSADANGVGGVATVNLTNTGTLSAIANANADADSGGADADASVSGISQSADANGASGLASVSISNGAGDLINFVANANADGTSDADASVDVEGITQSADAGGASGQAIVDLTNSGTLNIIGNANAQATAVTSLNNVSATATISGITQSADANGANGIADVDLTNNLGGSIVIAGHATAIATGSGDADADVTVEGISQSADANGATGQALVTLTNNGSLTMTADASAVAVATSLAATNGSADADASISSGISQFANANGTSGLAQIVLTNGGTLTLEADAKAVADGSASASATIDTGISQSADANGSQGRADITLTNTATINLIADATATGDTYAFATANVTPAITQSADANGLNGVAEIDLTNSGTINVIANAKALSASSSATASAEVSGITQSADANGTFGTADVSLVNSGVGAFINITANATATAGASSATASASVEGISQSADANGAFGQANVSLTNSGTINIEGNANAKVTSASFFESAEATVSITGITQSADANGAFGVANVDLVNSGTINIVGNANAITSLGSGSANASVTLEGISQSADASGAFGLATVNLTNTATILLDANAVAIASEDASASASVSSGISQFASANGTFGTALIALNNGAAGTININADARATADSASAFAYADGIDQDADANGAFGLAGVDLVNNNIITISATADANGTTYASASATASGITQEADANGAFGTALVELENTDTITVKADADANATNGTASAFASVSGISQSADANGPFGRAGNTLTNSGTINLDADANAVAQSFASASASVDDGIEQYASANGAFGVATADLTNTGTLNLTADARATSTNSSAFASADIFTAIYQSVSANGFSGEASASLINHGEINIIANAVAIGENDATASVSISGISQNVNATGTDGVANAFLSNTGNSIHITGNATATGFDGTASASVSISGLNQDVDGNSFAQADMVNSGLINIEGNAQALADDDVFAFVFITDGIVQVASASAPDGDANALLANSGTLNMLANAHAQGDDTATASAWITDPVDQTAIGGEDSGEALASFENSGVFLMNATATALGGDDVRAIANIGNFGGAIHQFASAGSGASAIFTNGGTPLDNGSVTINASAKAMSDGGPFSIDDDASASAHAFGINQTAIARTADFTAVATVLGGTSFTFTAGGAEALASVVNNGAFTLTADAEAFAVESANAHAHISSVIDQFVNGTSAQALIDNNDPISADVEANATGSTQARASATIDGINQTALASDINVNVVVSPLVATNVDFVFTNSPSGPALASLDNDGGIVMSAFASALGGPVDTLVGGTAAVASAFVDGVDQEVRGLTATAEVINDAQMRFNATANAGGIDTDPGVAVVTNATSAFANATASGISQSVTAIETEITANVPLPVTPPPIATGDVATTPVGSALASVVNNAAFEVGAEASAVATSFASADAFAFGVFQAAAGLTATAEVVNGDVATFDVDAEAFASGEAASATASAQGIVQLARAVGTNTDFAVSTTPTTGGGTTITVATTVTVTPVGTANASVTNTGTMRVEADATAIGSTFASAVASAGGVFQSVAGLDWNATFINGPGADFDVGASASASADSSAFAFASATGYELIASGGTLTVDNNSTFNVTAVATALGTTGTAFAHAIGLAASAVGTGTPVVFGGDLNGTIDNDAAFRVLAKANGPGAIASTADAHGIILDSGANTLTITNTSLFDVRSITSASTGNSTATGILARDNGVGAAALADRLTINNNGGTIFVGESVNGGTLFRHGMAIDVSTAPNPTIINLRGAGAVNGSIYGDIDIAATDIINVSNGRTSFDGKINPEFHPQPGVPLATLPAQGADPSPAFGGTLNILSGGSLYLRDNDAPANLTGTLAAPATYDGAAKVYIGTLNANAGGNLAYELQTGGASSAALAHYPQIFANTANLGGSLEIVVNNSSIPSTTPLLYDNVLWDNVIEADTRNGTFANLIFTPPGALINASIVYDGFNNVDIRQTRTPFGQLGAETPNQRAVGGGIEAVYTPTLTGPFGFLLAEIFTLNAAGYYDALTQLSGVQYPLYTHALRNNTFTNNMFVADQTDCAIDIRGVDACRNAEKGARFWILGTYNWGELDSTSNFIGYDAKNWAALLGVDYRFGNGLQLGVFGGYRNVDVDFDIQSSSVDSDGFQLGLTGAYDVGDFYIRGVASYSSLNGDSERQILIGSGPGLVSGTAVGEPDTRTWSFYGEAGARFDMGKSWLTPFVAIDHTAIKLRSFTETGVPGANLAADSQTNSQTSGLVGLKWAGNFGGIVPEAKIAYRHDFGSRFYGVDLRFADAPAGSNFRKAEPYDRGSIVAGLSLAGVISDRVTGRIGWQGRFNDEVQDHAVYGSLTFKFGGAKPAPEPAPAPEPVPPPPPEPVPPPPVEAVGPYIVFFDWDKDEITPQAAAILDNAAASYQQTGSANVVIAGHADRSGSDSYNVGLSQRRATNVRTYLAGRGVPDGAMTTEAFGESRPLVETADGVREPQNRRVEITYGPGSGQ